MLDRCQHYTAFYSRILQILFIRNCYYNYLVLKKIADLSAKLIHRLPQYHFCHLSCKNTKHLMVRAKLSLFLFLNFLFLLFGIRLRKKIQRGKKWTCEAVTNIYNQLNQKPRKTAKGRWQEREMKV